MGKILYYTGLVQASVFGLITVLAFVLLTVAYFQTSRENKSASEQVGTNLAYLIALTPAWATLGAFFVGLCVALFGQMALVAADFHERHFGVT